MKPAGIESVDCTNLTMLAEKAQEQEYMTHIGIVSFDNSRMIRRRLEKFPFTRSIAVYGLDNIYDLNNSPFENA